MSALECLLLVIFFEARGEGYQGALAVGTVVMNRMESDKYPETICDVIREPYQFTFLNGSGLERKAREMALSEDHEGKRLARKVAMDILWSNKRYPFSATHYLNPMKLRKLPEWADRFPMVASVGSHWYFEE